MGVTRYDLDKLEEKIKRLKRCQCSIKNPTVYDSQNDADNDTELTSGMYYQISGDDTLKLKQ